jgi:hypothetical protein
MGRLSAYIFELAGFPHEVQAQVGVQLAARGRGGVQDLYQVVHPDSAHWGNQQRREARAAWNRRMVDWGRGR